MVSVFYDPARDAVAEPPQAVLAYLQTCAVSDSDGASG
jgi:hypothetical protein